MKDKVEEQWKFLFDAVYGETEGIKNQSMEAIGYIEQLLNSVQDLIGQWNDATAAKNTYSNTPTKNTSYTPTSPSGGKPAVTKKEYWQAKFKGTNASGETETKIVGKDFDKAVTKETAETYFKKLSE